MKTHAGVVAALCIVAGVTAQVATDEGVTFPFRRPDEGVKVHAFTQKIDFDQKCFNWVYATANDLHHDDALRMSRTADLLCLEEDRAQCKAWMADLWSAVKLQDYQHNNKVVKGHFQLPRVRGHGSQSFAEWCDKLYTSAPRAKRHQEKHSEKKTAATSKKEDAPKKLHEILHDAAQRRNLAEAAPRSTIHQHFMDIEANDDLKSKLLKEQEENAKMQDEEEELAHQLNTSESKIGALTQAMVVENRTLGDALSTLRTDRQEISDLKDAKEKDNATRVGQIQQLEAKVQALKQAHAAASTDRDGLKDTLNDRDDRIHSLQTENQELLKEQDTARQESTREMQAERARAERLEDELGKVGKEKDKVAKQLESVAAASKQDRKMDNDHVQALSARLEEDLKEKVKLQKEIQAVRDEDKLEVSKSAAHEKAVEAELTKAHSDIEGLNKELEFVKLENAKEVDRLSDELVHEKTELLHEQNDTANLKSQWTAKLVKAQEQLEAEKKEEASAKAEAAKAKAAKKEIVNAAPAKAEPAKKEAANATTIKTVTHTKETTAPKVNVSSKTKVEVKSEVKTVDVNKTVSVRILAKPAAMTPATAKHTPTQSAKQMPTVRHEKAPAKSAAKPAAPKAVKAASKPAVQTPVVKHAAVKETVAKLPTPASKQLVSKPAVKVPVKPAVATAAPVKPAAKKSSDVKTVAAKWVKRVAAKPSQAKPVVAVAKAAAPVKPAAAPAKDAKQEKCVCVHRNGKKVCHCAKKHLRQAVL